MSERLVTMLSSEQIAARVREIGAQITEEYKDKNLVLVVVLKGSFIFASDLCVEMERKAVGTLGVDQLRLQGQD